MRHHWVLRFLHDTSRHVCRPILVYDSTSGICDSPGTASSELERSSNSGKLRKPVSLMEGLAQIPHFIQDNIFPLLNGFDQVQLVKSSQVLFQQLKQDVPPKIICAKCLQTLISGPVLPEHVAFLHSSRSYSTTVAVTFCQDVPENPFDSNEMKWARDKFFVGMQKHKGTPLLHCSRCRNIVAVLTATTIDDSKLKSFQWAKEILQSKSHTYKAAQQIFSLNTGTKYVDAKLKL